jgi:NodT family efflux transporter outer membrane factor (OMF) lipoprotein
MHRLRLAAAALLVLLGGCSLAPRYERPAMPTPPPAFKEAGDWKLAVPADAAPRGAWWTVFGDGDLDALESQVSDSNQNLKAALARLEQARAQTRAARSGWFPTLTANASATRERTSLNVPTSVPGRPTTGDLFTLGADLSYEIDLFGRVRNTVAGARYSEQATAGDTAALDLSVHAELATDYFTLRGLDVEQRLLDHTVADYARALALTQNLYQGGAVAIADVQQAQAQLETARTQAEDTRLRRAQTEHAIAVLVGRRGCRRLHRQPHREAGAAAHGRCRPALGTAGATPRRRGRRAARRGGQCRHRRGAGRLLSGLQSGR